MKNLIEPTDELAALSAEEFTDFCVNKTKFVYARHIRRGNSIKYNLEEFNKLFPCSIAFQEPIDDHVYDWSDKKLQNFWTWQGEDDTETDRIFFMSADDLISFLSDYNRLVL